MQSTVPTREETDPTKQDYAGHESILVADVDCIAAGKSKCDEARGLQGWSLLDLIR